MATIKKKILITGAAGFVGSHLVPHLLDRNNEIIALVKNSAEKSMVNARCNIVVIGDLSKKGKWQKEIRGVDIIIHLAAQISAKTRRQFEKNNSIATKNLINAAKENGVEKIILFSSAAVTSIRLDDYAKTKKEQEELVKKSQMKYAIIRPSMIYGPGDTKNIGWLISIVKKTPIILLPGGGKFGRQPVFVKDLCTIVEKIIKSGVVSETYEIHGFKYVTMETMVKTIAKKIKRRKFLISVPLWVLYFAIKVNQLIFPNPKFTTDQIKSLTSGEKFEGDPWWETFGIIPTKFEAGVSSMLQK